MGLNAYANTYKSQQIHTASREQLLILLFDGAIRFLNNAKAGLEEKNIEKFHNNVIKSQRIIMEFMTSLDLEIGGEMAQNLFQLYEYLHYRLVQANLKKDVIMLDEVLEHLRSLKATWEEAIGMANQQAAQSSSWNQEGSDESHQFSA